MKLGIKCGLKSNWKSDILASRPEFVELWFHSAKIAEYDDLFAFLDKLHIPSGLHFWGALPDSTMTNLGYPNSEVLAYSRDAVKRTIDTAAQHNSVYVNIHPNGDRLTKVDFENEMFTSASKPVALNTAIELFKESAIMLSEYAKAKGTLLTIESCPAKALGHPWHGIQGRLMPTEIGEFTVPQIESLFELPHIYFANDFGHTASEIVTTNRIVIVNTLFDIARRLKQKTKLLHVSYIIPPYNGTDYHGSLYSDELNNATSVPNHGELIQLLKLYQDKSDVYALVEPAKDHPGNFAALKKLVEEAFS